VPKVLTISRLKRWSIRYYNDTAATAKQAGLDRQAANGGLGEYYSEADTRIPTWLITGDQTVVADLCGLDAAALAGGAVDTAVAAAWLDDGIAPNGQRGRAFTEKSVHGFDLTFAAPKSVSLIRALTDPIAEKVLAAAHENAIAAAMAYLHEHAGYTRVHNPVTGCKDLQRLPGLVGMTYQHETSRCGDPHLHTHVIVSNRQARADGVVVSLDSKSLYHEAKAAGMIYQATLRHELHVERGFEWAPVDPHSGMAEIAGITKESITAWSRRSTRLRAWAAQNLVVVDGEPTAAQLAAAQKATRPTKPERWRGRSSKPSGAPMRAGYAWIAMRTSRRVRSAPRPRMTRALPRIGRGCGRRPRASTRPGSPAPIWSNSSPPTSRWTPPGNRANSSKNSPTASGCASPHPGARTNAKGTRSSP
jgi:conjugative relaxase-like TrwC/TraI family protein